MALFGNKKPQSKSASDKRADATQSFFDEYLREELRNHSRTYFEGIITENATRFKEDLDATVAQINTDVKDRIISQLDNTIEQVNIDIKEYVARRLDEQFVEYGRAMKETQDTALESLKASANELQEQHHKLSARLQENITSQEEKLTNLFEATMSRISVTRQTHDDALKSISESAKNLQDKYQQVSQAFEKSVADQQEVLLGSFQENMARILEHYLLSAMSEQFDVKAQLPSILKQMEDNKQAIVDDMKL